MNKQKIKFKKINNLLQLLKESKYLKTKWKKMNLKKI